MRTTETPGQPDDPVARGRDVNIRAVARFGFWLAVGVVAVTLAMLGLLRLLERKGRSVDTPLSPIVAANLARTPPEPRLEAFPLVPVQRLRAEEEAALTSYAWVDKPTGVARIPIDRAMKILVERGLPVPKQMQPPEAALPTPGAAPPAAGGQSR